jgi:hypothetical protein
MSNLSTRSTGREPAPSVTPDRKIASDDREIFFEATGSRGVLRNFLRQLPMCNTAVE